MKAILLCAILFASITQPASALTSNQSDAQKLQDIQVENQKLRDELAAAKKRIQELESASGKSAAPTPASARANPAADFMGNPIAVLDFLNKKFTQDMAQKRVAMPQVNDSKATRENYLAKAKEWIAGINRTSYSIDWRGRIVEMGASNGPYQEFQFQCVSSDNKTNYGRVIFASVLKSNAPNIGDSVAQTDSLWKMNATLEPTVILQADMLEPNTFDNPPLIAPCVAFQYKLVVNRLFMEKN